MKKTKMNQKEKNNKQYPFQRKWLVTLLAIFILSMGFAGGYIMAQSGDEGKEKTPSKTTGIQEPSTQGGTVGGNPSTYKATVNLRRLYGQLKCVCGTCNKTVADCVCKTAKIMKNQIALAKRNHKSGEEILNRMIDLHGFKVLAGKAGPSKSQPPPGAPRPAIDVEPDSYDFGTIPQEVVTHSFVVKNKGDGDLVIGRITTSCGCTKAQIDQNTIPPGKEATLTVTFDPILHDTRGKTTKTVNLKTNDPLNPVKKIKIRAFVSKKRRAGEKLPSYAYNSAQTLEGYRLATQIPDVLEVIPCYCGCGTQSNHRHLKDCFIKPDGSFDEHGSGCNLCDREAIDVKNWLDQKLPIREIRARIDEKYRRYGVATQTPPI